MLYVTTRPARDDPKLTFLTSVSDMSNQLPPHDRPIEICDEGDDGLNCEDDCIRDTCYRRSKKKVSCQCGGGASSCLGRRRLTISRVQHNPRSCSQCVCDRTCRILNRAAEDRRVRHWTT